MDMEGILLWVGLLFITVVIAIVSRRMKRQIEEAGIETAGVVSRIEDVGGADDVTLHCYVKFHTATGEKIESLLFNSRSDLAPGVQVRIKVPSEIQDECSVDMSEK